LSSRKAFRKIRSTRRQPSRKSLWVKFLLLASILGGPLWFVYREWQNSWLEPEAIFVLGGGIKREPVAAKLAAKHPNIPIWVSGGTPQDYAKGVFGKESVDLQRLKLDYRATDTITNFTSMVDKLQAANIKSVYLVTSDYHMNRSRLIGEIIFGSRGIAVKPVAVKSDRPDEPVGKVAIDGARAVLWLFTGHTAGSWVREYKRSNL
jgi:uncharacterized SAM-binding protein YcdF (DUF218 family)